MDNPQLLLDMIAARHFGTALPFIRRVRSFSMIEDVVDLERGDLPIALTMIVDGPFDGTASLSISIKGIRDLLLTGQICGTPVEGHLIFEEFGSAGRDEQGAQRPSGLWKLSGYDAPGFFVVARVFRFSVIIPPVFADERRQWMARVWSGY